MLCFPTDVLNHACKHFHISMLPIWFASSLCLDPRHNQSWVPRTPKHSTWCKTLRDWYSLPRSLTSTITYGSGKYFAHATSTRAMYIERYLWKSVASERLPHLWFKMFQLPLGNKAEAVTWAQQALEYMLLRKTTLNDTWSIEYIDFSFDSFSFQSMFGHVMYTVKLHAELI